MSDLVTSYPLLTLVPPVLALTLVILTRKVLISLGSGVVAAALLIHDLNPLAALQSVWAAFAGRTERSTPGPSTSWRSS